MGHFFSGAGKDAPGVRIDDARSASTINKHRDALSCVRCMLPFTYTRNQLRARGTSFGQPPIFDFCSTIPESPPSFRSTKNEDIQLAGHCVMGFLDIV